jgi:uncharacterized tellurite resistance protein B-like protein
MHIVLALLGTIVTILVLLSRLANAGIDLGGLNPFLWNRRRKWRKKHDGNPIFRIEEPLDATAILMVAIAKSDGDMTREDKTHLLNIFENKFNLSKKEAAGLLISSSYLLADGTELNKSIPKFLAPSKTAFTETQSESALALITEVANNTDTMHPNAQEMLRIITQELSLGQADETTW